MIVAIHTSPATTERMTADRSAGMCDSHVPVTSMLNGASVVIAIAAPSTLPIAALIAASHRIMRRS
jgi:hypothetical protein